MDRKMPAFRIPTIINADLESLGITVREMPHERSPHIIYSGNLPLIRNYLADKLARP
jgi:hypothetical protein